MQSQVETQNTEAFVHHISTGFGMTYSQEPFIKLSIETEIYPTYVTIGRVEGSIVVKILQHSTFSEQPSVFLQAPSAQHQKRFSEVIQGSNLNVVIEENWGIYFSNNRKSTALKTTP